VTAPGAGQNINLAALWIPVMPETSHMGEEMKKAGAESKRKFEEGFNSGTSPEAMGAGFTAKMNESMKRGFGDLEIPFGVSKVANWFDQFGGAVDDKVVNKLKGQATEALRSYAAEHDKLSDAQARATDAENKLNLARDNGFNKASIMVPLISAQTQAHAALADQLQRTTTAHDQLTTVTSKLSEEQGKAASSSQMMAGAMGGLVVVGAGLAFKAIEELVDMIKEGFEAGIEVTKELAEQTLELGEKYEQIGLGVREFSNASGEAFEELESRAQKVFGTLDVAGENTGQTMAQLSSILGMEAGPALDLLTKHVEELQGRFTNLKTTDLASIFYAFKVPAQETDRVLASLVESARGAGQGIGDLVNAMKGDAAETLHQAGLNAQQAGAFIADMMKMGGSGRQVMTGLQTAMKDFGKEGLTFGDGMKLAGQRLKELGDTADGQELAEKLFGTRKWATAMQAAQDYVDVVSKGPEAYDANASSLDQFLQQTQTLENKWEEVKHKIEEALMPLGSGALTLMDSLISGIKGSFDKALPDIRLKIKQIGDSFIDNLPAIQGFVAGGISLMGPLFDFIKEGVLLFSGTLGGLVDIYAQVTGDDKLHDSMVKFGEAQKKIQDIDFTKLGDQVSGFVSGISINSDDIKKKFDAMWDSARGEGADQQSPGAPLPDITSGLDNGPHGYTPGAAPGAAPPAGGLQSPGSSPTAGPQGEGHHNADWDAIAAKESSGRWNEVLTTGVTLGGGLQIKDDTWYQFGGLKYTQHPYQATKEQQEEIAERILNGWGTVAGQGPKAWENGSTYVERKALGGAPGRSVTSGRGQGDDVAALLKRGEYVWDTDTMDKYGWLITALHQGTTGFDIGGGGSDVNSYGRNTLDQAILAGVPSGHYAEPGQERDNLAKGMADCSSAIEALVNHLEGRGLNAPSGMYTGNEADFLAAHGFMPGEGGPGDFRVGFNSHHTQATLPGGTPFNWGSEEAAQGRGIGGTGADDPAFTSHYYMPMRQAGENGGYPGLPGQFGGSGVYGGETYDQQFSAAKAVQEAQDRASDLDTDIAKQQRHIKDLQDEINAPDKIKIGLLGQPEAQTPEEQAASAAKRKSLNEQLDDATTALAKTQRERSEQDGNITEAQRKQQESMYKKPSGTGQSAEGKAGETLGSGLLAGIGQELGLGDVFGKSPMDWGIVKLAEGLLNYGNGLGDAIFGKSGGLGGPGGSGGMAGGMATGMLGSLGIKLPNAAISASPNVIPVPMGSPASGMGSGAPPGPPVINNDNSITVQAGVDDKTILGPVQSIQNASNSAAFQYSGGWQQN
jgi:hypothetical protein